MHLRLILNIETRAIRPARPHASGFRFAVGLAAMVLGEALAAVGAPMPSAEELWRLVQEQQRRIDALTARVAAFEQAAAATERKVASVDEKVEAASSYVETLQGAEAAGVTSAGAPRTRLGGYGEMHLGLGNTKAIDFHRWVLFVGHDFSERIRVFSEVELEHSLAGEGKKGEVELEQAYVEFDLNERTKAKAGLFVLPIGVLNETHEPATFFGVERNRIESEIVPTTWWEGGVAVSRQTESGFSIDLAVHSGLSVPTSGPNAFRIRSGRQKVSEAPASDPAVTSRLKFTGVPGLELAVSAQFQTDLAQGALAEAIDAALVVAHADWRAGGFGLRALYGRWDIGGALAAARGADVEDGFYLEPSYRLGTDIGAWGVFARYSRFDLQAGDAVRSANAFWDFGVAWWPHEQVVLKADVQWADRAGSPAGDEIVNLGAGFQY